MNYKMKRIGLMIALFTVMISGCQRKKEHAEERNYESICDLAYTGGAEDKPIIYLEENSGIHPYFVVTDNYQGYTLLLRKEVLPQDRRISEYGAYYEQSEMDIFLNGEFMDSLSEDIRTSIQEVSVEILKEECLNQIEDETVSIQRKVFLLSYAELGYDNNGHVGSEGMTLQFFKNYDNRRAYAEQSEKSVSWWLRSADSLYDSCVYAVGPDGEIGSTNAFDLNGVRPAFCVKGDLQIRKKDGKFFVK